MAEYTFEKSVPYSHNADNFEAEGEIMVRITLNEYRDLVADVSRLKTVNEHLRERICELAKDGDMIKLVPDND